MRLLSVMLLTLVSLCACESADELLIKSLEAQLNVTIKRDWHEGVPLNDLVDAAQLCRKNQSLQGCAIVATQLQDLAVSLASCEANQRSYLCQQVVLIIHQHRIATLLPVATAQPLPGSPFYWKLPTLALDAQASHYGYRRQAMSWWWVSWRTVIITFTALIGFTGLGLFWRKESRKNLTKTDVEHIEPAAQFGEDLRDKSISKMQNSASEKLRFLSQEDELEILESSADEQIAQQESLNAAKQLAIEQAEATAIMAAAFGKHV
jgi:hypothetical protein